MKKKIKIWVYPIIILGLTNLLISSCKKDTTNNTPLLTIGQSYQGGIIGYLLLPGDPGYDAKVQHGLIASPSDQSASIVWWNGTYSTTGSTATVLGSGNDNTNTIVASQGTGNYAAKICYDLVLGGYSDWFLPSKDELHKLYNNRVAIGGFSTGYYWNSSEMTFNYAYCHNFANGNEEPSFYWYYTKNAELYLRAVRSF